MPASHSPGRPRVLVVDDDVEICVLLSRYLDSQGLSVRTARDGRQLREAMHEAGFDVVLLDLGLPDEDGLDLMRVLRRQWQGPVIIVSGRGEPVERIIGLELGADDYVSKPFDLRELLARIRSVLRRARPTGDGDDASGFEFEGWRLDVRSRRLTGPDGSPSELTSGEFDLLRVLLQRAGQVLTRDQLMNALHGHDAGPYDRAIDVQVGRLRRKIEADPARPQFIKSVRGAGYLLAVPVRPL